MSSVHLFILFIFFATFATQSSAQNLYINASLCEYKCDKTLLIKIEIRNKTKDLVFIDKCLGPKYTINSINRFNLSISSLTDSLSIVYPASILPLTDFPKEGNSSCLTPVKPNSSIYIYVDLENDFTPNKISTQTPYIASIFFKTVYFTGKIKKDLYFTKKLFRIDKKTCYVKVY